MIFHSIPILSTLTLGIDGIEYRYEYLLILGIGHSVRVFEYYFGIISPTLSVHCIILLTSNMAEAASGKHISRNIVCAYEIIRFR